MTGSWLSMATKNVLLKNVYVSRKAMVSQLLLTLDKWGWYQIKVKTHAFYPLSRYKTNYLICIFKILMKPLESKEKQFKKIKYIDFDSNHNCCMLLYHQWYNFSQLSYLKIILFAYSWILIKTSKMKKTVTLEGSLTYILTLEQYFLDA